MLPNKLFVSLSLMLFAPLSISCASSQPDSLTHKFNEYVPLAVQEFKRKDQLSRYYRTLSYGLIGLGFGMVFFRNSSSAPQAPTVGAYTHLPKQMNTVSNSETAVPISLFKRIPTACKSAVLSIVGVGAGFFSWFVSERLLHTVAYGLISPLLDPIQRLMSSQRTVLADDIWFLREQVRESRSAFVLVSIDMHNFVDALKAWELDMRTIQALMRHVTTVVEDISDSDYEAHRELIQLTQERICCHLARMVGHVKYMCTKATDLDLYILETVAPVLQRQVEAALNTWIIACRESHQEENIRVTSVLEQSIRSTFLPLLSVSLYRIHPWPAAVACSDYAQSFVTSVVASRGNPLT